MCHHNGITMKHALYRQFCFIDVILKTLSFASYQLEAHEARKVLGALFKISKLLMKPMQLSLIRLWGK